MMKQKLEMPIGKLIVGCILMFLVLGCLHENPPLSSGLTAKFTHLWTDTFFNISAYSLTLLHKNPTGTLEVWTGKECIASYEMDRTLHIQPLVVDIDEPWLMIVVKDQAGRILYRRIHSLDPDNRRSDDSFHREEKTVADGLYYREAGLWFFYSFAYMGGRSAFYRWMIRNTVQVLPPEHVLVLVNPGTQLLICSLRDFRQDPGKVIPIEDFDLSHGPFPNKVVNLGYDRWFNPRTGEWLEATRIIEAYCRWDEEDLIVSLDYSRPLMTQQRHLDPNQFSLELQETNFHPVKIYEGLDPSQLVLVFSSEGLFPGGERRISYVQNLDPTLRLKDHSMVVNVLSEDGATVSIPPKHMLKLDIIPVEGGRVDGEGYFQKGEEVSIEAFPSEGFRFVDWSCEDTILSTQTAFNYIMPAEDVTLVAKFELILPDTYNLTLNINPADVGTVTGAGSYKEGESVEITATPNEGYFFVTWTDNGEVISPNAQHTYMMPPQNTTLVANFALTPEMVPVQNGIFQMGDEVGDLWWTTRPVHSVTLTYDYWIGKYLVTFDQYDTFCDATGRSKPRDEGWGRGLRPVIHVSWWDAIAYCNWLSERNGLAVAYDSDGKLLNRYGEITEDIRQVEGYRLPTEAEWEYAASGGHQALPIPPRFRYAGSDNIDDVAWFGGNSGGRTHPVGGKQANPLGLHDMSGNVWEWCHDWYGNYTSSAKTDPTGPSSASNRVMRGSAWSQYNVDWCRVAYRTSNPPNTSNSGQGFRLSRTDGMNKTMITAESSPTVAGDVRINAGDWSTHQQTMVDIGSHVTVEARANEGYEWEGWYEGNTKVTNQAVYSFDATDQNRSLTASFQAAIPGDPVTIRSKAFPNFGGKVGINDQGLSEEFRKDDIPAGQSVTLHAQPHKGWVFKGWWEAEVDQALGMDEVWVYQPDGDIDLIALFDPNIYGLTEWDFHATVTIAQIAGEDLESPFVYGTSGGGTVTITQNPVRMVGSATFPAPNFSAISEAAVRSVLAYGLRRTLAKAFPTFAPLPSVERVKIPSENIIRIRGPENGEFTMDYDVTFHDFNPEDPYDSALTRALAQFEIGGEDFYLVVEIVPNILDPQKVEFRVNLLYITDEEQEIQEEITGHLDCIVVPRL